MGVNPKGILINNNNNQIKILQKKFYNHQEVNKKYKIIIIKAVVDIAMSYKIIFNKNLMKIIKMNKIK